jgi:hypothetical protein
MNLRFVVRFWGLAPIIQEEQALRGTVVSRCGDDVHYKYTEYFVKKNKNL